MTPEGLLQLSGVIACACVTWYTRPVFYSIAIKFGFSGKAFVC